MFSLYSTKKIKLALDEKLYLRKITRKLKKTKAIKNDLISEAHNFYKESSSLKRIEHAKVLNCNTSNHSIGFKVHILFYYLF